MTDQLPCPACDAKGWIKTTGRNPGTGNTFTATQECPTCKGTKHVDHYPEAYVTPTTTTGKEISPWDTSRDVIQKYEADFAQVLPSHIKPETWIRLTTSVFRTNKDLAKILHSNPGSVLAALLDAARLGLEPGDNYHLVPFGGEVVGIADYTGLIELMYRAGAVTSVKAELVYSSDQFEFSTDMPRPIHKPNWFGDRGTIIGAYAYADMRDGSVSRVVVRSKAEIEKVRDGSKLKNGIPWTKWYDRMALKTVLRELEKFVPSSSEIRNEQAGFVRTLSSVASVESVDTTTGEVLVAELVDDGNDAA